MEGLIPCWKESWGLERSDEGSNPSEEGESEVEEEEEREGPAGIEYRPERSPSAILDI